MLQDAGLVCQMMQMIQFERGQVSGAFIQRPDRELRRRKDRVDDGRLLDALPAVVDLLEADTVVFTQAALDRAQEVYA